MKKTLKFALAAAALCVAVTASAVGVENGVQVIVDVPEPVTLALMGAGLVGMGVAAARRRKASKN